MSAYITFYLRSKDNTGEFLEAEWFCQSSWIFQALAREVKFETYCRFDEKIAAAAMGWLGERIEATEDDIAAVQELIDVVKEIKVETSISEKLEIIEQYQKDIAEYQLTIKELRAAQEVIARYRAISEYSENAYVYIAYECDPNGVEE